MNAVWVPTLVALGVAMTLGAIGGGLTRIGPWYRSLRNPAWKPPDWAFGPIWAAIYTFCTVAAALAWNAGDTAGRIALVAAFALNAPLNVAWTVLFFRAERPDWALIELIFLWLSVAILVGVTLSLSVIAGLLLLPYLGWVTVAGFLNRAIVRLNGPFGIA